jgi:thioredoxin reductase
MAVHQANLFRQWSDDVVLFVHDGPPPTDDERALLATRGVAVVEEKVEALAITGGRLTGVRLANGEVVPRRALAVGPRFVARAGFLADLGLEVVEHPQGVGTHVPTVDPTGRTAVPGVWVAGNVTDPMAQVVSSAAAGTMAGAVINADLISTDPPNPPHPLSVAGPGPAD